MPCCENVRVSLVAYANLQGLKLRDLLFPMQSFESPLACLKTDLASQLTWPICPFDLLKPINNFW